MVIKKKNLNLLGIFVVISALALAACGSNDSSSNLSNTNTQQEFLPVDEAFEFSANATSPQILKARWNIAEGYHLYKDKFKFGVAPASYKIVEVKYPKAEIFSDKNLGKLESYKGSIEVVIEIAGDPVSDKVSLSSTYQGCADVGLCYPPETRTSVFNIASL